MQLRKTKSNCPAFKQVLNEIEDEDISDDNRGEESIEDGYQEDDNVNMDNKEGSIDQEMEQKMVEDSMDDNKPENDFSIDVHRKKHAKQKRDLLFEERERPIKNSRRQKTKSKILSETTGWQVASKKCFN